jgi:hypothetical protein
MSNYYVISAPTGIDEYATWAPFADDTGVGYRGTDIDGNECVVTLRPGEDGLNLVVDGVLIRTYVVGSTQPPST